MNSAEPYHCRVCGSPDPDLYLRCYRGDCPDGRDRAGVYYPPESSEHRPLEWWWIVIGFLIGWFCR